MSYNEEVRDAKKKAFRKVPNKATYGTPDTYTFHPTDAQRTELSMGAMSTELALEVIEEVMRDGCKLVVGKSVRQESFYATVRDNNTVYPDDRSVTAFHGDLCKALQSLAYCLKFVAPEFPLVVPQRVPRNNDW